MRGVITFLCPVAGSVACTQEGTGTSGSGLTGDPSRPDCGFTVAEPPPPTTPDPCTAGTSVFGPERFERGRGTPEEAVRNFSVPALGAVCVRVSNAGVSSAEIRLDGALLIPPSRFNPHVTEITERSAVVAGDHVLGVSVRSSPGSAIEIEVRFAPGETASYARHEGRFLAVQNLRDDPDPFSPGDPNGVRDTATFSVEVDVQRLPGSPWMTYRLRTSFEIADPIACGDTRRLVVEIPVAPGTVPRRDVPTAAWDGRDAVGALVPDGGYFYRAVTELVRTGHSGRDEVIDRVTSDIQRVTVDNTPPRVELWAPVWASSAGPDQVRYRSPDLPADVTFFGITLDERRVTRAVLSVNGEPVVLPAGGTFSVPRTLHTEGSGPYVENPVELSAVDDAGNESRAIATVAVVVPYIRDQLAVRFNSHATEASVQAILSELGGSNLWADLTLRYYVRQLPEGTPVLERVSDLNARAEVAYAVPIEPMVPDTIEPPIDDERLGTADAWHLDNSTSIVRRRCDDCTVDADCPGTGQRCLVTPEPFLFGSCPSRMDRYCACTTDANCPDPLRCIEGDPTEPLDTTRRCGMQGEESASTHWLAALDHLVDVEATGEDVLVGISDAPFQFDHRNLREHVWTNMIECCGAASCPDGDGDGLPDCTAGQSILDPAEGPEEQCPGQCGADDDNDGLADFGDPEVASLVSWICTNRKDDDADGATDECCVAPWTASCPPPGDPTRPGEELVAAEDDDENGCVDDMHGCNFIAMATRGARGGSTLVSPWCMSSMRHSTATAGIVGATIDNVTDVAGIDPRVQLVILNGSAGQLPSVMRYAAQIGVDVVNMSWHARVLRSSYTSDEDYRQAGENLSLMFFDAMDPQTLYFNAAGNDRRNLDLEPVVNGLWRFPAQVDTSHVVVVAATNMRDELVDRWSSSAYDTICPPGVEEGCGSMFGASTVDLAAPGDAYRVLSCDAVPNTTALWEGTSFSSPVAAAVAGLGISAFPNSYRGKPLLLRDRLFATVDTAADSPGLASLSGRSVTGGRVNVQRMLEAPLPPSVPPYANSSRQLGDYQTKNSHDLDAVDGDGDGDVDFLFEVYGGPFPEVDQPRLFEYRAAERRFVDRTFGADGLAGGTGDAADRLPDLRGNYNKADHADFDRDGCTDLVLAGFLQADPSRPPDGLKGARNRLLFQVKDGATCTGRFREVTDELVGGSPRLPTRDDMTRDADAFDADGDTVPDILFTNALFPWPGGDLEDQLLINRGDGSFRDESWRLRSPHSADPHRSAVAACDVDNDGDLDLVQAVNGDRNRLLVNDGGTFTDDAAARGFPAGTGFSHDVECHSWTDTTGAFVADPDPFPEIVFARRDDLPNLFLVNTGGGVFADRSDLLPDVHDTTQEVEICDLLDDGVPEILFGDGDIVQWKPGHSRLLRVDPASGRCVDAAAEFGFDWDSLEAITEDIDCTDLDGDTRIDAVLVANTGGRNWLYLRQ